MGLMIGIGSIEHSSTARFVVYHIFAASYARARAITNFLINATGIFVTIFFIIVSHILHLCFETYLKASTLASCWSNSSVPLALPE